MIGYRWCDTLDERQLRDVEEMLAEAGEFDAEAGFSTATPSGPAFGAVRHLLVTIAPPGERGSRRLDELPDVPVVAYLRLDSSDGTGEAQLVVRPAFRSHGIATLLTERLDEEDEGWRDVAGLDRLSVWAHGAHPAADRMARRFGATVDQGVFKTLRLLGGSKPFAAPAMDVDQQPAPEGAAELVRGHRTAMAPAELATVKRGLTRLVTPRGSVVLGGGGGGATTAFIAPEIRDGVDLHAVLAQGLLHLQAEGARVAQMYVDALDEDFVRVSRELEFQHDQSDLLYVRAL